MGPKGLQLRVETRTSSRNNRCPEVGSRRFQGPGPLSVGPYLSATWRVGHTSGSSVEDKHSDVKGVRSLAFSPYQPSILVIQYIYLPHLL